MQNVESITIEMKLNNVFYHHGIAYNKAYNSHKALFSAPVKGRGPFCNEQFEAFGFSKPTILQYYAANQKNLEEQAQHKRETLIKIYRRIKNRMTTILRSSVLTSYGRRQEFRIRIILFKALDLHDKQKIHSITSKKNLHRCVFISIIM